MASQVARGIEIRMKQLNEQFDVLKKTFADRDSKGGTCLTILKNIQLVGQGTGAKSERGSAG